MRNSAGFTLIEILIALAIFAVLAVVSAVGLHSLIKTHEKLQSHDAELRELFTAVTLIRRDVSQLVQREVADTSGSRLPALLVPNRFSFEFTRLGYVNPEATLKRSTLQRVAYVFDKSSLYRLTWPVIDRAPKTSADKRIILTNISYFRLNFVDDKGLQTEAWADNYHLPRAIILNITFEKLGEMQLILPIVGRGYAYY